VADAGALPPGLPDAPDGEGLPEPAGDGAATSGTASRIEEYTPSFVAQMRVGGASSAARTTYIPRMSSQPRAPPASRNWPR
jgi:hypothetical protein